MNRARLIVVSNRLPVTLERLEGQLHLQPSSGGLVSALLPAFRHIGGCWIGWPGPGYEPDAAECLPALSAPGCSLLPVFLTESEQRCFYHGWSNEIIWPLFHDLQSKCTFDPEYWLVYREVNDKFADVVEQAADGGDFIWVHDYHLMMLADALRSRGSRASIAYFHHIPFPAPDIFEKLPWRCEILRALLQFTSIAFQTGRDCDNFVACLRRCLPGTQLERPGSCYVVRAAGACATVGAFPISIDYASFASDAAAAPIAERALAIRRDLHGRKILLGIDRLDYTKGVLQRLAGFRTLLDKEPSLRGNVALVQVVVPSREAIPEYAQLKDSIECTISRINGDFGTPAWNPICYWHRSLPREELLALYRAADIAVITPLKDGMNLVAKEFCASRVDERGVLVLSEFAGAAAELAGGALLVNPYDTEGIAAALHRALHMGPPEQYLRMQNMRRTVQQADVFDWCRAVWRVAGFRGPLAHQPRLELVPQPRPALASAV